MRHEPSPPSRTPPLRCRYENNFHGTCTPGNTKHNERYKDANLFPEFGLSSFQRFVIVRAVRNFGGQSLYVEPCIVDPDGPPCSAKEGNSLCYQCTKQLVPNLLAQV